MPSKSSRKGRAVGSQQASVIKDTSYPRSKGAKTQDSKSSTTNKSTTNISSLPPPQSTPAASSIPTTPVPPPNWPSSIPYLSHPVKSPFLPPSHHKWLRTRPPTADTLPIIPLPLSTLETQSRVEIKLIDDPNHPAYGQRGLFAARDLSPDELVVGYLGCIHGSTMGESGEWDRVRVMRGGGDEQGSEPATAVGANDGLSPDTSNVDTTTEPNQPTPTTTNQPPPTVSYTTPDSWIGTWDTSSYDLNMYRDPDENLELAIDAAQMGNEARFVNDYRGVPVTPVLQGSGGAEDRRGKRRVRTTEVETETDTVHGEGIREGWNGQTAWQGYQNDNGGGIAMPNSEFRDVWFEMSNDIDLELDLAPTLTPETKKKSTIEVDVNAATPVTHPEANSPSTHQPVPRPNDANPIDDSLPPMEKLHLQPTNRHPCSHPLGLHPDKPPHHRKPKTKRPGLRGVAIFVMPAGKSGKRKQGIRKGQEILVSYGKGFWAHHSG